VTVRLRTFSPSRRTLLGGLAGWAVAGLALGGCTPAAGPSTPTAAPTSGSAVDTPAPTATSCREAVAALSPAEQAGQLVMVGHYLDDDPAATGQLVADHHLGAVILMGNTDVGVAGVRRVTDGIRAAAGDGGDQLLVAVDQEGGQVRRLRGEGFSAMPSAAEQAAAGADALRGDAQTWGKELAAAGVDVDLAPVADVVPADQEATNEPIARWGRGFGSDPTAVAADVTAFIGGMRAGGTATAVKHFPGLGRVTGNTDFATGVTDDRTTRKDPLLAPFRAGIAAGTDMVMISSAHYSRIDPDRPAIWSDTIIDGMLRGDLGWTGVVVSDDLGVAAQVRSVEPADRAIRFVQAGGDIAVTVDPSLASAMVDGLAAKADADPAFADRLTASAARVLGLKATRGTGICAAG